MKDRVIYDIDSLSDCKSLDKSIKYVTVDIKNVDIDVISYLVNNGNNYLYTDRINDKQGYVFVDYATFVKGQSVIDSIVNNIPSGLSKLEIARYLYINLGKSVGYDINVILEKNEYFSLENIRNINNIWNCLANGRITGMTLAKIYLYLCSMFNIECDIITNNRDDFYSNKIIIDDNTYVVNLGRDIALIQAGFPTKYFASFNHEIDIDKKIGYIKREYNDVLIDKILSSIDYLDENMVYNILIKTQKVLNVSSIKPVELSIIYNYIFNKYCPNYDIAINNLYINDKKHDHFILITYNDKHYSYNYALKKFLIIDNNNLVSNLDDNKIGLYNDEIIPNVNRGSVVL